MFSEEEEEEEEKEYKGRTDDNNSSIGPNEAVRVVTLYFYSINMLETKGQQSERLLPTHASLQPKLFGRGSDTM